MSLSGNRGLMLTTQLQFICFREEILDIILKYRVFCFSVAITCSPKDASYTSRDIRHVPSTNQTLLYMLIGLHSHHKWTLPGWCGSDCVCCAYTGLKRLTHSLYTTSVTCYLLFCGRKSHTRPSLHQRMTDPQVLLSQEDKLSTLEWQMAFYTACRKKPCRICSGQTLHEKLKQQLMEASLLTRHPRFRTQTHWWWTGFRDLLRRMEEGPDSSPVYCSQNLRGDWEIRAKTSIPTGCLNHKIKQARQYLEEFFSTKSTLTETADKAWSGQSLSEVNPIGCSGLEGWLNSPGVEKTSCKAWIMN